jgi:hypothetical protein
MPLADEKAVTVWIAQRFGIKVHLPEIQGRRDLSERARTAQMSRLADTNHRHDVSPELPRDLFDSLNLVRFCHPSSSRRRIYHPGYVLAFQLSDRAFYTVKAAAD